MIKQQSKALWLNQGDQCTRAFITKMKQKKLQAYVYAIKDKEGGWQEGFENVAHVMTEFYQQLLGTQLIVREPIDKEIIQKGSILDIKEQLQLIAPFSDKDIKEAMFSIHPMKSPGLDGYSSSFLEKHGVTLEAKYARQSRNS